MRKLKYKDIAYLEYKNTYFFCKLICNLLAYYV